MRIKIHKKIFFLVSYLLFSVFFVFIGKLFLESYISNEGYPLKIITAFIVLWGIALYVAIFYFNIPTIEINNNTITFKTLFSKEQYPVQAITNIQLTGKFPIKFFFMPHYFEGMKLEFSDGAEKYLFDTYYRDLWKIKKYLHKLFNEHELQSPVYNYFVRSETIKGNLLSLDGISIIWIFVAAVYLFLIYVYDLASGRTFNFISFLVVFLFLGMATSFGRFLNYVIFEQDRMIIRNYLFFWYKKIFAFKDIREVVFRDEYFRLPDGLRIITNEFQAHYYPFGIFNNNHWERLHNKLQEANIEIRYF